MLLKPPCAALTTNRCCGMLLKPPCAALTTNSRCGILLKPPCAALTTNRCCGMQRRLGGGVGRPGASRFEHEPPQGLLCVTLSGAGRESSFQQSPYCLVCVRAGITPVGPGWSGNKLQLNTIQYNTLHTIRKLLFARTARKHKIRTCGERGPGAPLTTETREYPEAGGGEPTAVGGWLPVHKGLNGRY